MQRVQDRNGLDQSRCTQVASSCEVFSGKLDGLGHRISGLTIRYMPTEGYIGLIGLIMQGAEVRRLQRKGGSVSARGDASWVGARNARNEGLIEQVTSTGPVAAGA